MSVSASGLFDPKIKDLVNKPKAKYEQIYNNVTSTNNETEAPTSDMKVELQNYLSELSKTNNTSEPTGTPLNQNSFFDNNCKIGVPISPSPITTSFSFELSILFLVFFIKPSFFCYNKKLISKIMFK